MDVRMLGKGRPFLLEVANPKSLLPRTEDGNVISCFELQQLINKSTELIIVTDLQIAATYGLMDFVRARYYFDADLVRKANQLHLLNSENEKRKHYRSVITMHWNFMRNSQFPEHW